MGKYNEIELLKKKFEGTKLSFGYEIIKNMSTKTDNGNIFPPYIPFVGVKYKEFKVLIYSTAQNIGYDDFRDFYANNINKLVERLYFFDDFEKKYPKNKISYKDVAINPYRTGVIASLLGVYFFAKYNKIIKDEYEINDWIGISNYYKFSLNNGKTDINPETKIYNYIKSRKQIEEYYKINDELVEKEIKYLKPNIVISFKGRKLDKLNEFAKNKVIKINDPSWILQGGSGVLKSNGSWEKIAKRYKDSEINKLVDYYCSNWITGNYNGKKDAVKIYLLKYYSDWVEK